MRRTIITILAFVLAFVILIPMEAFAEMPDFTTMTVEELHDLINKARNELVRRELVFDNDTVLIDQDGVKVYLTGKYTVDDYSSLGGSTNVNLEAVVINDTDKNVVIHTDYVTVNGWDVYGGGISATSAGHKQKGYFQIPINEAELKSYDEIEDVIYSFVVLDADNWQTIFTLDPVTIHFN